MCCGTKMTRDIKELEQKGLVEGHAYTIVSFLLNFSFKSTNSLIKW